MLFYTVGQGSVFLWMVSAGFLIGALYDVFRLARCVLSAGTALSLALDAVWGALSGVAFCAMLTLANRGEMRLYALAAAALGCALYAAAVSNPMARLGRALERRIRRLVIILSKFRLFKIVFK